MMRLSFDPEVRIGVGIALFKQRDGPPALGSGELERWHPGHLPQGVERGAGALECERAAPGQSDQPISLCSRHPVPDIARVCGSEIIPMCHRNSVAGVVEAGCDECAGSVAIPADDMFPHDFFGQIGSDGVHTWSYTDLAQREAISELRPSRQGQSGAHQRVEACIAIGINDRDLNQRRRIVREKAYRLDKQRALRDLLLRPRLGSSLIAGDHRRDLSPPLSISIVMAA